MEDPGQFRVEINNQRVEREAHTRMPTLIFVEKNGQERAVDAPLGLSVLEIAHKHGVDIEGACEGSLACSTCHVIVGPTWYPKLAKANEDEEDMLDLALACRRRAGWAARSS